MKRPSDGFRGNRQTPPNQPQQQPSSDGAAPAVKPGPVTETNGDTETQQTPPSNQELAVPSPVADQRLVRLSQLDRHLQERQVIIGEFVDSAISDLEVIVSLTGLELEDAFRIHIAHKMRPPKFINPDNDAEIWEGVGHKPGWIKDFLKAGGNLRDFLNPEHPEYSKFVQALSEPETEPK